jgi:Fe-S-cluster containining protein
MRVKDQLVEHGRLMTWDDAFNFKCHPGIDCFNSFCKDVTILLTPVDVVRLRRAINLTSMDFLDLYTHRLISRKSGLLSVALKMIEDEAKKCPFVKDQRCSVYDARPYSCRLYPLDTAEGVEYSFIADASRCHGLRESEEWTVERWRKDQDLYAYDDLDHNLKDVMAADALWEAKIEDPRMQDMFLMALYDPDRFREFVFKSSFLKKFSVDKDILERIREDDIALLYFGGQWLRFVLFGQKGFLKMDHEYLNRKKQEVCGGQRREK